MKCLMFLFLMFPMTSSIMPNLGLISKALSSGDAATLASYFDESVEVTILNEVDIYSQKEAKQVVQSFFDAQKPKNYAQVHEGTSKGKGGQYCIGNLTTNNGKYRVYLYLMKSGSKYLIQEIRFEQE